MICGATRCILSIDFICERRKGKQGEIDDQGLQQDGPAPVGDDVAVHPLEPEKQRTGDDAEPAEVDDGAQIGFGAGNARDGDGFEIGESFGADIEAGVTVGPRRLPTAAPRTSILSICCVGAAMGNFDRVAQSDHGRVPGILGHEDGGEILVGDSAQLKGPGMVPLPLIFLIARRSTLSLYLIDDLAGRVLRRGHIGAETGRPHGKGGDVEHRSDSTAVCAPTT